MASDVADGSSPHPPLARVAVGLLALVVVLLACVQVVGMRDFLLEDSREADGVGAVVALLTLQVLSMLLLGAAAWFLGRFVAGYRPRWLLGVGLVVAGSGMTFASWVVWLGNFSGG